MHEEKIRGPFRPFPALFCAPTHLKGIVGAGVAWESLESEISSRHQASVDQTYVQFRISVCYGERRVVRHHTVVGTHGVAHDQSDVVSSRGIGVGVGIDRVVGLHLRLHAPQLPPESRHPAN